jgi:hypothetical protein
MTFEQVSDRLKQLGNAVADLAQNHADVLDSLTIQDSLFKFRKAYEESVARLNKPNFTIATIGTTSSGKSTIVNALIGRKIAPIEAGEMSGGILTIKHSQEFKLSIEETEGAQWLTGEWKNISEKEIYDRIRNGVMFPYHQARQKQELIAPQVTVHIPILPVEDASLLGLPEGVGIEFIDLPGLKSIQDRDNLRVIQQQVHKAFSLIRSRVSEEQTLKKWFRDIEDRIDDGATIDDESMRKILYHVNDWSGGDRLWKCMRDRVQESFSELVILPALIDVLDHYKLLINTIDIEVKIKKIGKKEELETKQQNIIDGSERLAREVENIRDQFQQEIRTIIDLLKQDNQSDRNSLEQKGIEGFDSFYDTVRQVEEDLVVELISSVRNAFEQDKGTYELEEELTKVVTPPKARAIAKAYDLVNRKLNKFQPDDSGYFIRQVRHDDQAKLRSMEHAEKAVRSFYYAMRKAISSRAEFTLQGQTKQFETGLLSLVNRLIEELKIACEQELPDLDLDKVIILDFENHLTQNLPQLPEELFSFSDTIKQNTTSKREVVGKKKETQHYTEGSCFKQEKTRTITKNIYDDIEYKELKLPDYKNMARQWAEGITQEKQKLWDILDDWISKYLDQVIKECDRAIDKAIKSTERAFDKQLREIEKDTVKQAEYWQQFELELNSVTEIYQQLR